MATIATLAVNLIGNVSGLKSALGEAQGAIRATADKMSSMGKTMSVSVTAPLVGFGLAALKGAAEQEQLQVAFTTMLGSAEKANTLIKELSDFSASTPFQMPEVVGAGKQLLAFGVSAESVQPALTKLGDLAAGVGAPIGDLAYLYGTAKAQGRLFMADVNQFSSRGIPMIEALAATMGVAQSDVRKLIEEGKVGFPEMDAAINHLTGTGSKFGGLMEAQSATLAGLFSTLQDTVGLSLTAIGAQMVESFDLKTIAADALVKLGLIKDAIINFAKTQPQMFKMVAIFLAAAAALGPLLIGLGFVMSMLASAIPVITALGGAFGFLLGPIGLVIGALAALVYFDVFGLQTKLAAVGDFIRKAFAVFQSGEFKKLGGLLVALGMGREQAYALAAAVGRVVRGAKDLFSAFQNGDLFKVFDNGESYIGDFIQTLGVSEKSVKAVGAAVYNTREAFAAFMAGSDVSAFATSMQDSFTSVKTAIADLFSGEISFSDFVARIGTALSEIPTAIREFFTGSDFATLKTEVATALGLEDVDISLEGLKTSLTTAFDNLSFADSLQGAKNQANSLRDVALAWVTEQVKGIDWKGGSLSFAGLIDWVTEQINQIDWSSISLADIAMKLGGILSPSMGLAIKAIKWIMDSDNWSGLVEAVKNSLDEIQWGEIGASLSKLGEAITSGIGKIDTTGLRKLFAGIGVDGDQFDKLEKGVDGIGAAFGRVSDNVSSAGSIFGDYFTRLRDHLATLDEAGKGAFEGWELPEFDGYFSKLGESLRQMDEQGKGVGKTFNEIFTWDFGAVDKGFNEATGADDYFKRVMANFEGIKQAGKEAFTWDFAATDASFNTWISGVKQSLTNLGAEAKKAVGWDFGSLDKAFLNIKWPALPDLSTLKWPTLPTWTWPPYLTFTWPAYLTFTWPVYLTWTWTPYNEWKWPSIPMPGWVGSLLAWSGISAGRVDSAIHQSGGSFGKPGTNADGTGFWKGGLTWVGEQGPELINLPRGSQVLSNPDSMALMKQMAEAKKIGALAEGTTSLGQAMQNVSPIWRPSKGQLTAGELVPKLSQMVSTQIVKPLETAAKKLSNSIENGADDLREALRSTPGLFSTSQVTQKQLDLAALGIPQNFADDWIRHLTDEVVNGVQWADADIRDAALRVGIDPGLPAQVILDMVKEKWNDQSFFANADNLDLVNLDAIKAEQERLAASKLGEQNLLSFLGIPADQVQGQGVAVGTSLRAGITQGIAGAGGGAGMGSTLVSDLTGDINPKTMAPVAGKLMDSISAVLSSGDAALTANFGSAFATLINDQLEKENPFAETGSKVLSKITESWASLTQSATDLIGPLADAMNVQLDSQSVIEGLMDVGARMVKIVFAGFDEEALGLNWVGSVQTAATSGGSVSLPGNALGTQYWRGGATWVGERGPELIMAPRGSQIVPNGRAQAMAGSDGKIVIENFHARSEGDVISFAYQVDDLQRRRRRR